MDGYRVEDYFDLSDLEISNEVCIINKNTAPINIFPHSSGLYGTMVGISVCQMPIQLHIIHSCNIGF